jgi:serine/threonine protein kinase
MSKLTGQSIGRYHILEQLGEGGMAIVYKAYDTRLERNVALKVLRTDLFGAATLQQVLQRFEREAKSLAKLSHPNIVNILDYGEHEGSPFLVMEYLPGGTLKQKLGHAIPWQEAIHILIPVARGLSYAHQHGVIHRDVKPANILINENEEPVLTDFGIAKLLEGTEGHTLTGSGVGIGTPEYMAPEQGIGASTIDARADIYSLGIVFYEMVTGRKPYIADTPMAVVLKQMTDPLPRPTNFVPDLPEDVERILFKALAKQPEDRYTAMSALVVAMESLLVEPQKREVMTSVKLVKETATSRVKPFFKLASMVVGVLAFILVIVFGAPWIKQRHPMASGIESAPAKVLNAPPATYTLSLSTSTLEPSQLPTLTETPLPTITNTPLPDWVSSFAEPILAVIANTSPHFEDDFSQASDGWRVDKRDDRCRVKIQDGFFTMSVEAGRGMARCSNSGLRFNNFVLRADIDYSELGPSDSAQIGWHGITPYHDDLTLSLLKDGNWSIYFCTTDPCTTLALGWQPISPTHKVTVTIISKNKEYAIYMDEIPVSYINDIERRPGIVITLGMEVPSLSSSSMIKYDNLKIWNLDHIPNLP